ncbi:MAG: hypothetical protein H0T42_15655 [Deltaproteobacteria bacterium]|nr:hypothetical protein [Deltaproteobacteria bacterium]
MRFLGALFIVCASVGAAIAETPQQQADKLFAEGRALLTVQKDSKAACEKFEAAIKLDATATGTMLNLGLCYENLGKYATSIKWFRKAQAAASENKLTDYENAAKDHTVTIAPKVPSLKITVDGPPDAEIRIDNERVDATTYGRVEVDAGAHVILGRAPGKKKVVQTVEAKDGQSEAVVIAFAEAAIPVYVDRGTGRRRAAVILAAAGLGGLVFTGVYSYIRYNEYHDEKVTPPGEEEEKALQKEVRLYGTTMFVVSAAALTAGVVLYLTAPGMEQISDGTAFAPVITNEEVGFSVSGTF